MNSPNFYNLQAKTSIIFWGTPEFALPTLDALVKNGYEISAVITNPDKPVGRKQIFTPPPVKVYAEKHKIPVFQPVKLNEEFQKEIPDADIYIIAAYGKIIPKSILDVPKFGVLNVHPSLLPRWRGPSPIQYTILNDDVKTGVTIMKTDERMDHGPILAQQELGIYNFPARGEARPRRKFPISKTNYTEIHDQLAKLGAELLLETLPKWLAGKITPIPQDDSKATYSKILKKDDGRIDWEKPAENIERMIRAFNPWPGTWTIWPNGDKIFRLRIEAAEAEKESPPEGSEGFIWVDKNNVCVKTGMGSLRIKKITPSGKKTMTVEAFIKGYRNFIGSNLV